MSSQILITGASGFVGTALTKYLLEEGAEITTLLAVWEPQSYFVSSGMLYHTHTIIGSIEDYNVVQQVIADHHIDTLTVRPNLEGNPRLR